MLEQVRDDAAVMGIAGEQKLLWTVYLVATSRLLQEPLAATVQAPSSSGKSFVTYRVADLIPPESENAGHPVQW